MLLLGEQEVKVTGVYEDLPDNSSFTDVAFIAPWELYIQDLPDGLGWGHIWFQTIVQLTDNAKMDQVSATVKDAVMKRVLEEDNDETVRTELFLQPMAKAHLYSDFEQGVNVGGRIQYVWLFGTIGVFVLLLACINFMNLSTARSEKRAKEIGVRKAIGSRRSQLVRQFFTEAMLVAILSFVVALLLSQLALPAFNEVAGKEIRPSVAQSMVLVGRTRVCGTHRCISRKLSGTVSFFVAPGAGAEGGFSGRADWRLYRVRC